MIPKHTPYILWIYKHFKTDVSSFPPSRLFWPMLTVSKLAHREAYKSANISSRGRDGTAQRARCNYLHTVVYEEVRCTSHYRKFGSQVTEWVQVSILYQDFTDGLRKGIRDTVAAVHNMFFPRFWYLLQPQKRHRLSMPSAPLGWCILSPRTAAWETLTTAAAMTPESDRRVHFH